MQLRNNLYMKLTEEDKIKILINEGDNTNCYNFRLLYQVMMVLSAIIIFTLAQNIFALLIGLFLLILSLFVSKASKDDYNKTRYQQLIKMNDKIDNY